MTVQPGPVLEALRRWGWLLLTVVVLAMAYRIFVQVPREARQIAVEAGQADQRIQEVKAAAARGDDAEVQRRHAQAIGRAEKILEGGR